MSVTFADIENAAALLVGHVVRTPSIYADALSRATGADVYLKVENFQVTGSFKARGALVKLASLSDDEKSRGIVAASAGNHAQGVAYHAGRLGIQATIYMPEGTPFTKVGRTEAHGANVILTGADFNAARETAIAHAEKTNALFVPPYDDPAIIAGQGTVAVELIEDVADLDALIAPIGGGGLMAGCAIAASHMRPSLELIGAQTRQYPSMSKAVGSSLGGITLADGIAVKSAGSLTRPIIETHVSDVVLLDEQQIESAVRELVEGQCIVAEGSGAAGVAALLADPGRFAGRRVGIVVSGGNIDSRLLASVLMRGLVRSGRLVRLRIAISDLPGTLSKVSGLIGKHGGNIIEVYHQRLFFDVPIRQTDLDVVIETVDDDHVRKLVTVLQDAGFETRELSNSSI